MTPFISPLLAPNSPLDQRARDLVAELHEREARRLKALPVDDALNPVRRRRVEITRTEIAGQPDCIRKTLDTQRDDLRTLARVLAAHPPSRLYLTGCGDSLAVMIAARVLLEEMFGVPCEPIQALDMAYYFHRPVDKDTLVVGLSSSGETPRTVEAMVMARALGARTLALSNTAGSTMTREADNTLFIHAERKGWPTQASTAALALVTALALAVGAERGMAPSRIADLRKAFDAVPDQIAATIDEHEPVLKEIAEAEASRNVYLFSGGGPSFACAFFGAAKVKECTPDHAIAIPLEEYHHYHSQKAGDPLFLIAPNGLSVPRARDTAEEGLRYGGFVYVVTAADNVSFDRVSTRVIRMPPMIERLSTMVYTVPSQLYAYHLAMSKFAAAATPAASGGR